MATLVTYKNLTGNARLVFEFVVRNEGATALQVLNRSIGYFPVAVSELQLTGYVEYQMQGDIVVGIIPTKSGENAYLDLDH